MTAINGNIIFDGTVELGSATTAELNGLAHTAVGTIMHDSTTNEKKIYNGLSWEGFVYEAFHPEFGDAANHHVGDTWLNTSTNELRGLMATNTWVATPNVLTARMFPTGAGESQYSSMIFGGNVAGGVAVATNETFDGVAWSSAPSMIVARTGAAGAGSVVDAAAISGDPINGAGAASHFYSTERYDGISWSLYTANLIHNLSHGTASGVPHLVLLSGGHQTGPSSIVQLYNASTWVAVPTLPLGIEDSAGGGKVASDTIIYGGFTHFAVLQTTYHFDGSSWSTLSNMVTGKQYGGGRGSPLSAISFGGISIMFSQTAINITEMYDGITWNASTATLPTSVKKMGFAGGSRSVMSVGGLNTANTLQSGSARFTDGIMRTFTVV